MKNNSRIVETLVKKKKKIKTNQLAQRKTTFFKFPFSSSFQPHLSQIFFWAPESGGGGVRNKKSKNSKLQENRVYSA